MDKTIIAILIVVIGIGLFIGTYILNRRTPKPEGCENLSEECEGCQILTCSHRIEKKEDNK